MPNVIILVNATLTFPACLGNPNDLRTSVNGNMNCVMARHADVRVGELI